MSIIPDILKTFDYYKNKLPLYLQNDEAFLEHFRIWYDFLVGESSNTGVAGIEDTLLSLINIFDDNYLEFINSLKEDPNDDTETSDILDKLGNIFNIKRNFSVTYKVNNVLTTFPIELNDKDFITFIQAQIIKNYSDGSYKQMREFYDKAGLYILFASDSPASTRVYLINTPEKTYSNNIRHIFAGGLLTIESMGITYDYSEQSIEDMLIWNEKDDSDEYGWGDYNLNPTLVTGGKLVI